MTAVHTSPTMVSKTAQVLKFFAQQYMSGGTRNGIPRKRLMKMAYMSDFLAREHLGHPLTDFAYYRYEFGPYDRAIEDAVKELVDAGLADDRRVLVGDYINKVLLDRGLPYPFEFGLAEMEVLNYVASTYLPMGMEELLRDVVYPTLPFQKTTQMEEVLPMGAVDNRVAASVPFDLEAVLLAEKEIDRGKFVTNF